jgi:hypothetical protein
MVCSISENVLVAMDIFLLSFDQIVKYTCFQFVIAKIRETKKGRAVRLYPLHS